MRSFKTEGIVIKRSNYSEADRIVTIFTKQNGKIKVKATERIRKDCVYMVHGFGHNSKMLKGAYMKGASDAGLVTKYNTDPVMGGTGMNVNFVTIEQWGGA